LCRLVYSKIAVISLLPCPAAIYGGVYAPAREYYGGRRRGCDIPNRIAQRQGCMRECTGGGAFAETILCTLFGYMPKLGDAPELLNADTPRGFVGELRHVRHGVQRYIIRSGDTGVELRKET